MFICMYMYLYLYTYIYIYQYTYLHRHSELSWPVVEAERLFEPPPWADRLLEAER